MPSFPFAMTTKAPPKPFDFFVVLDFEATCDSSATFAPQEIIEFPSILVDAKTGNTIDEFHVYCQPRVNSTLTPFCTELTGITQDVVDHGVSFAEAFQAHQDWLRRHFLNMGSGKGYFKFGFVTCGHWDLKTMLPRQAELSKISVGRPYNRWINIKKAFGSFYQCEIVDMLGMLATLKIPLEGRHHSGIDDCRNIATILRSMLAAGAELSFNGGYKSFAELREKIKAYEAQIEARRTAGESIEEEWLDVFEKEPLPTDRVIHFYSTFGYYGCFSNFSRHPFWLKEKKWPTSEHYFQAQKHVGTEFEEKIRLAEKPADAARMGRDRSHPIRDDWQTVRDAAMREALVAKFTQNEIPRTRLLETEDCTLVEHTRNDNYWGDGGDGSGTNMLGKLLMSVREELREAAGGSTSHAPE